MHALRPLKRSSCSSGSSSVLVQTSHVTPAREVKLPILLLKKHDLERYEKAGTASLEETRVSFVGVNGLVDRDLLRIRQLT